MESQNERAVRKVLWGNALFSAVSGGICSVAFTDVSVFLGAESSLAVMLIGIGLLGYAAITVFYAQKRRLSWAFVLFAALADTTWVVLSTGLVTTNFVVLQSAGVWSVIVVALIVAGFAAAQIRYWLLRDSQGT